MNRMTLSVMLMALLTLFMLSGALPAAGGNQAAVLASPVFIGLAAVLAALMVDCACQGPWALRRAGYILTHLGVVVILGGALAGWLWGESHDFMLPIRPGGFVREMSLRDGRSIPLPFGIACRRFSVEYYALTNDWLQQRLPATPRTFSAEIAVEAAGGAVQTRALAVNHPVAVGGWRFYLMSYDAYARSYVELLGRRDPGRGVAVAGIWMLMAGTVLLGLQGWGRKGVGT